MARCRNSFLIPRMEPSLTISMSLDLARPVIKSTVSCPMALAIENAVASCAYYGSNLTIKAIHKIQRSMPHNAIGFVNSQ